MIAVGIDVGGTKTRVGAFSLDGTGLIEPIVRCHPSVADGRGDVLVGWIIRVVREVIEENLARCTLASAFPPGGSRCGCFAAMKTFACLRSGRWSPSAA